MADRPQTDWQPYRAAAREPGGGQPLTPAQERALGALVELCPEPGQDVLSGAVSKRSGLPPGSVVTVLRSLGQRRLVVAHDEGDRTVWAPTLPGRARVRGRARAGERRGA
jgi:hypothetical protein